MATRYDRRFYDTISDGSQSSAAVVVPLLNFNGDTVIDVGCGRGWWGAEFARHGIDVLGIDGEYVTERMIPFQPVDLAKPFDLGRRFDLAICLEVAEHLLPHRAEGFVADLCRLADVVVFSAAIPHQSGAGHVNCQWPSYWADLFAAHGYGCIDVVREQIWDDDRVEPWYRQNLLVFEKGAPIVPVRDLVHPVIHGWGRR